MRMATLLIQPKQGKYPVNYVSDLLATHVLSLPIWPELEGAKIEQYAQFLQQSI